MIDVLGKELHTKVQSFKKWTEINHPEITEENDNGEWCFCTEFDEMYSAAIDMIQKSSASKANNQIISDLLYVIARDNECGNMIQVLNDYPDWFSLLCKKCLHSPYTNAKWQFAIELKNYREKDDLKDLIYEFLATGDEYTERMALQSLAYIAPNQAEEYAIRFWNREIYEYDEYQKIMVLHVLYHIHSESLNKYLEMAEKTNYTNLKINASEIRKMTEADNNMS
ncbi:hypothetical protein [Ruminococcus sp.]|uniref:hypothetical protein n=1 Tax=Ruminococcus sp. TaxID=41978 RepID=UPI0025EB7D27|nr:hypothetical protein [Ruminococcus sp.]